MTAPQDPFRTPDGQPEQPTPPGQLRAAARPARWLRPAARPAAVATASSPADQPGGYGPPPGRPGGYGSPAAAKRNGFGVAALVLGILALLLSWTVVGGVLLGIAAIVFGVLGRGRAKRGEADNGGLALAGLVLGVLGLLAAAALVIAGAAFFSQNSGSFGDLTSCLEQAQGDATAEAQCQSDFEDDLTGG